MNEKQKKLLMRRADRVEKALATLGKTSGEVSERVQSALALRLEASVHKHVSRLQVEQPPLRFEDLEQSPRDLFANHTPITTTPETAAQREVLDEELPPQEMERRLPNLTNDKENQDG